MILQHQIAVLDLVKILLKHMQLEICFNIADTVHFGGQSPRGVSVPDVCKTVLSSTAAARTPEIRRHVQ